MELKTLLDAYRDAIGSAWPMRVTDESMAAEQAARAAIEAFVEGLTKERDAACEETRQVFSGMVNGAEHYGEMVKDVAELRRAIWAVVANHCPNAAVFCSTCTPARKLLGDAK